MKKPDVNRITPEMVQAAYKKIGKTPDPLERFVLRVLAEARGNDDPWEWADAWGAEYAVGFLHGFMDGKGHGILPYDKRYSQGITDGLAAAAAVFGDGSTEGKR